MIVLHYTWIGPPDKSGKRDVAAPRAMAKARYANGGEPFVIDFWCLNKHQFHYRDAFSGSNFTVMNRQKVRVRSIEAYLEERVGERRNGFHHRSSPIASLFNWARYQVSWDVDLVVRHIIEHSTREGAAVREIVNAKNIWSLYVISQLGGYAMDTGVGPSNGTVCLKDFGSFRAPREQGTFYTFANLSHRYLNDRRTAMTAPVATHLGTEPDYNTGPRMDVWTLFAPAGDAFAEAALQWYMRFWYVLEDVRCEHGVSNDYKDLCRNGIISAVMTGITCGGGRRGSGNVEINHANTWDAELEGDDAGVPELSIDKAYYGSHH